MIVRIVCRVGIMLLELSAQSSNPDFYVYPCALGVALILISAHSI